MFLVLHTYVGYKGELPKSDQRCFSKLPLDGVPFPRYVMSRSPRTSVITRMREKNNVVAKSLKLMKISEILASGWKNGWSKKIKHIEYNTG